MKKSRLLTAAAVPALCTVTFTAGATNGMNLEGYGPVALGMGGAALAYDTGTAAMMNNPATLGLMPKKSHQFDLALGMLGPDVTSEVAGPPKANSSGDAYYMPAIGWASANGQLTWGLGIFGQGGMGTEYAADSFLAAGTGEKVRSEVSVGRLLVPVAYDVNDKVTLAGSLDYVWAGMDLKMAMSGQQFLDFMPTTLNPGATNSMGSASGSLVTGLGGFIGMGGLNPINPVNTVRFDFSDSSDYTGEASGQGFAAKLGVLFRINKQLSVGASYHSETDLDDLSTGNATLSMNANVDTGVAGGGAPSGSYIAMDVPIAGTVKVRNFQWPATYGIGAAYQANEQWLIAGDIKVIKWSDVMDEFSMTFTADDAAGQSNPLAAQFGGAEVDLSMTQEWDDQTVIALGAAYMANMQTTIRFGYNHADNPVPDKNVHPLFPAIVEDHYTAGVGYAINDTSDINFALSHAPEVNVTNSNPLSGNVEISHSQTSWQLMYTMRY